MLLKYRSIVDHFSDEVQTILNDDLIGEPVASLYEALDQSGFGQVDVVLTLLRYNTRKTRCAAEKLIGRPIQVIPCVRRTVEPPTTLTPDDRRVLSVVRNPRLPTTPSFQRFKFFKVGVQIKSLLKRGVTRRDIREATVNRWVVFG